MGIIPTYTQPRHYKSPLSNDQTQDIAEILNGIYDETLLDRLNDYRWTGRKGYPPVAMWRAVLVKYLLRIPYARDLLAQLRASRPLRRLCGFSPNPPMGNAHAGDARLGSEGDREQGADPDGLVWVLSVSAT